MEGEQKTSSYSEPIKLFVGCVPSEISLAALEEHFSLFGEVLQVTRLSRKKPQDWREPKIKGLGHCIVVVGDWMAADKILQTAAHTVQGRKLLVEPYLQGSARLQNVEMRNQKRFFLKGVPGHFSEEQLKDWLSAKHGEIEVMHEIKPRALAPASLKSLGVSSTNGSYSPQSVIGKTPTKIYSVQFCNIDEAIKFSKSSQRYFKNNRIQVERYDFTRGTNLSPSMEGSEVFTFPRDISSQQVLPSTRIEKVTTSSQRETSLLFSKPTQAAYHAAWTGNAKFVQQSEGELAFLQAPSYRFNLAVRRSLSS